MNSPVADQVSTAVAAVRAARPRSSPQSPAKTLLLASSNAAIRRLLAQRIEADGYEVIEVGDVQDAVKTLQHSSPHSMVVMSDLEQPGAGIELVRRLGGMATRRKMPIVLLVADPEELGEDPRLAPAVHTLDTRRYRSVTLLSRALVNFHATAERSVRELGDHGTAVEFPSAASTRRARDSVRISARQAGRSLEILGNVLSRVRDNELPGPVMPEMLARVQALLARETLDQRILARFAEKHQALAGRLLCVANSAMFSRGERIAAVDRAIARLGVEQTVELMRAVAALSFVTGSHEGLRRLMAENLRYAYFVAVVARALASRDHQLNAPKRLAEIYGVGLFHNVGSTFLYYATSLLHADGQLEQIDCAALRTMGRGRSGQLNRMMAAHMSLPDVIETVYEFSPEDSNDPLLRCVHRAMWIADQVLELGQASLQLTSEAELLGLDVAALEAISNQLPALRDAMTAYLADAE